MQFCSVLRATESRDDSIFGCLIIFPGDGRIEAELASTSVSAGKRRPFTIVCSPSLSVSICFRHTRGVKLSRCSVSAGCVQLGTSQASCQGYFLLSQETRPLIAISGART